MNDNETNDNETKDDVVNPEGENQKGNELPGGETDATPVNETPDAEPDGDKPDGGNTDDKEGGEAPENYEDFTVPEGVKLDETTTAAASEVFKELNLNQEQAQKLTDLVSQKVLRDAKAQKDNFENTKADWEKQSRDDKEIGGDKLEQSVADAKLALQKFGTPELVEVLETFGLGNHPEVIRSFARMGALMKEDNPGGKSTPASEPKDRAEILYSSDDK